MCLDRWRSLPSTGIGAFCSQHPQSPQPIIWSVASGGPKRFTASPQSILIDGWNTSGGSYLKTFSCFSRFTRDSRIESHRPGEILAYEGAYHDVLTGLCNRRQLSESFAELIKLNPSTPNAVMFVDLDRFKQVNDIHGHTVGDKLLLQVATRLTGCLSKKATLARIGGDEFIIVLQEATEVQANEIGAVLLHSITQPFSIDGLELLLSATVGVALYPQNGLDLATLQERADQAMYAAKAAGRNQIQTYKEEEDAGKKEHLQELSRDLIPLAERSGLIVQIGDWVLLEACKHCRSWQKQYTSPLGVTVNMSALQFQNPGFPNRVEAILRETGLSPSFLTLELTEATLVNSRQIHEHLCRLQGIGVNVALDDFGTGFSSLSNLGNWPPIPLSSTGPSFSITWVNDRASSNP